MLGDVRRVTAASRLRRGGPDDRRRDGLQGHRRRRAGGRDAASRGHGAQGPAEGERHHLQEAGPGDGPVREEDRQGNDREVETSGGLFSIEPDCVRLASVKCLDDVLTTGAGVTLSHSFGLLNLRADPRKSAPFLLYLKSAHGGVGNLVRWQKPSDCLAVGLLLREKILR